MWGMVENRRFSTGVSGLGVSEFRLGLRPAWTTGGQMKIMQMAFMIVAVFFFFVLVGLFFLSIQFKDVKGSAAQLQREQAISSLRVIADMPELSYDSSEAITLDEDKLRIMTGGFGDVYEEFWPVASVAAYKLWPVASELKPCPGVDCNYYELYDNGQSNIRTYSTYVSICKKVKESGFVYDKCEVGKLEVGVIIRDEE